MIKSKFLLAIVALIAALIAASPTAHALTGLQPVVIVSTKLDGHVADIQVRVIEAVQEGAAVDISKPIYVIQNTLDKRPEFERVQLNPQNLSEGRAQLTLREHDLKHGIAKRELLIPRPASANEDLAGYIAYASQSQIGYVKALERNTTWITHSDNSRYVVVSYEVDQGPRRFELVSGRGVDRQILLVPVGHTPAEIAALHDEFLVQLTDDSRLHHDMDEILVGSFSGMTSVQIAQTLAESHSLRCSAMFVHRIN